MALVHDLLDWHKGLVARRQPWMGYYQQLADVLLPNQADFTRLNQPGEQRGTAIYDGSPRLALRDLASTLDGLIKPKTSQWFDLTAGDDLDEYEEVQRWLEAARERMWFHLYRPDARFIQRSAELDLALACFGWGALWIGENRNRNGLLFRSFHISQVAIDENEDGLIDTISIEENLTPRQAAALYARSGIQDIPNDIKNAMTNPAMQADRQFRFVQLVLPQAKAGPDGTTPFPMNYLSTLIDVGAEKIVKQEGFHEFPAAVPRWETAPGEVYARSPGMMALPDVNTLQAMGKTLLVGGQRAVDPPIWVQNDSILSPLRTMPGGVTVVDTSDLTGQPFGAVPGGVNLPIGREMQADYRKQVEAAFFKNVFNLPIETRQMTATEIIERKEEFIRVIGPVFGRLETDYIGHVVNRVFGIMERAGAFPPRPDILQQQNITFRFQSPIQRARKQLEIAGMSRALQILAPLAEVQPSIMDNFDGDEIARDAPEWSGIPMRWMRPKQDVEDMRQAKNKEGQAQQVLAASGPLSAAIKNVAQAGQLAGAPA